MASKKKAAKKAIKKKAAQKKSARKKAAFNVAPAITTVGAAFDNIVPVTYVLTKTNDVVLTSFFIGDTRIDFEVDQDSADPNRFLTKGSKKYMCFEEQQGLSVVVRAEGQAGGGWSLDIKNAGVDLGDNTIIEDVDNLGRADHNQSHT